MKQLTYTIGDGLDIEAIASIIHDDSAYASASTRLVIIYEPSCNPEHFADGASRLEEMLPEAHIVGMTTLGSDNPKVSLPEHTMVTALLFESSTVTVCSYDCHEMTPDEAGREFVEVLRGVENVRGVLFKSSSATLWPEPFIRRIAEEHPIVPIFGGQAGTEHIANDESLILVDGQLFDRGILAVAFSGADLHIQTDLSMGFRPIGREMVITQHESEGFVVTIDNQPATSIYRKYLDVRPDEFFYENVCAFPLLQQSRRRLIARVPINYSEDGKLQFSMEVPKDTRVRLSYSKPEYLLRESLATANLMKSFMPQALLSFVCMNRRIFMGNDDADRELGFYLDACPDGCWCYGYGEVLWTPDGGGIINSSLVTAGFREGALPSREVSHARYMDEDAANEGHTSIPLSNRLVTFLETTTAELRDTIDELAMLAQRDMLTGLYNRHRMDELLNYELTRMHHGESFALLMLDIDHFKRINDVYGHDVGDSVLHDLTLHVKEIVRSHDILSRWGGEEFVCLAMDLSLEQAEHLAERIRRHIAEVDFGPVGRVTISIGVTVAVSNESVDQLIERVERALYDAKTSGRDRVCVR